MLRTVAQRLKKTLRHGETIVRLGGDEFAVIFEHATRAAGAELAQRIIHFLSEPYPLSKGASATIGASVGIALAIAGETLKSLMKRADAALYEAKAEGKGTFRFATMDIACRDAAESCDNPSSPQMSE
ncbi:diguanylate cyclase (GGDEF)-like protein [Paraburkholderia sp. Clong3]